MFFVLPRPHTVQNEQTFVQGPRQLEGIQEVFLVIMRPSKMPFINVEAYLETAHIHGLKERVSSPPTPNDVSYHLDHNVIDGVRRFPGEPVNIHWWSGGLEGYTRDTVVCQKDFIFTPPPGHVIALDYKPDGTNEGYEIVVPAHGYAFKFELIHSEPSFLKFQGTIVTIWPPSGIADPFFLFEPGSVDLNIAAPYYAALMDVTLRIFTRPTDDVPQIITKEKTMYLTGRGVCCGTLKRDRFNLEEQRKGVLESVTWEGTIPTSPINTRASIPSNDIIQSNPGMTIGEADFIRNNVGRMMINSINSNKRYEFGKVGLLDTQFVSNSIANIIKGKEHPDNIPIKQLAPHIFKGISKINNMSPRITKAQLLQMTFQDQITKYGLDYKEAVEMRRALLGIDGKEGAGVGEPTHEVEVPSIVGMQIDKASNVMRKAQLSIGESTYQDDFNPRGTVIIQHPEPRTRVPVNSDIYLVLSSGTSFQIPDIIGKKARICLDSSSYKWSQIRTNYSLFSK